MSPRRNAGGFTLVELLVVIAIIGILALIITSNVQSAAQRAKVARAQEEMRHLVDIIQLAKTEKGVSLHDITGHWDSAGEAGVNCLADYPSGIDLRNVPTSNTCYARMKQDWDAIGQATGLNIDMSVFYRDPWGSPYLLSERDGRNDLGPGYCQPDVVHSPGPDGKSAYNGETTDPATCATTPTLPHCRHYDQDNMQLVGQGNPYLLNYPAIVPSPLEMFHTAANGC